jgi:hypothetical protein
MLREVTTLVLVALTLLFTASMLTVVVLVALTLLFTASMLTVVVLVALTLLFTASMLTVVVLVALTLFVLMMFMHDRDSSFHEVQVYPHFLMNGLLFFAN